MATTFILEDMCTAKALNEAPVSALSGSRLTTGLIWHSPRCNALPTCCVSGAASKMLSTKPNLSLNPFHRGSIESKLLVGPGMQCLICHLFSVLLVLEPGAALSPRYFLRRRVVSSLSIAICLRQAGSFYRRLLASTRHFAF